ncbi:MAG: hypothetical protein HBSAPP03_08450 [Phycisphaerae bacterium]|nr:MAG: hypothetical protein HBSAPP03_08450 [Phycisphaerae bacterium]
MAAAVLVSAGQALAQRARAVNPDDSVVAGDALIRVRELADAGSVPEALRVLQQVLEQEGDRLLPSPNDPDLYLPVRGVVHELLLGWPELLARYRAQEGPRAEQVLAAGDAASVEQTRLLTPSGFEAVLRLAQTDMEQARFESARLMLEQLERHPERQPGTAPAKDAAALALTIASFIARDDVQAWAGRWATEAGVATATPSTVPIPRMARPSFMLTGEGPEIDPTIVPTLPLQSAVIDPRPPEMAADTPRGAWQFPVLWGETVYLADTTGIQARDATTLSALWSAAFAPAPTSARGADPFGSMMGAVPSSPVDPASPAVGRGVVLAHDAGFETDARRYPRTVYAFDARNGQALWGAEPSSFEERLASSTIRGPVVVADDVAIVTMREQGLAVRVNKTHLVGLDLHTGRARWVRLLGSVGTNPWGRGFARAELTTVDRGLVFRGDEMGILGAFEAATGRPRWVRLTHAPRQADMARWPAPTPNPAYEATAPLVVGDSVFYVEPGQAGIVHVSIHDGVLRAQRDGSSLGEPRYLLLAGRTLVGVGPTRVACVPLDELREGVVRLSSDYRTPGIAGRAVVAAGRVLLPLAEGVAILDPSNPGAEVRRLTMPTAGNILAVRRDESGPAHLLMVDGRAIHAYVGWDQARSLLDARVAASPNDPAPLLTYIELLHRAGQPGRIPALAQAAATLIEQSRDALARDRLFTLVLSLVRRSREAMSVPAVPERTLEAAPIRDPAIIAPLLLVLERAADTPATTTTYLLERGWFEQSQGNARDAVEAYQAILASTPLREAPAGSSAAGDVRLGSAATAGDEAAARLSDLLRRTGPGPYAAFDEEAALQAASASGDALADLARRYPASAVAADLWERSAAHHLAGGRRYEARRAAGAGLAAAELSAAIGRPQQEPRLAALASQVLALADSPADTGSLYRLMMRLSETYPMLTLEGGETPAAVAARLRLRLTQAGGSSTIGLRPVMGQVIEHFDPRPVLFRGGPLCATDSVVMHAASTGTLALWATDASTGLLQPIWTLPAPDAPPAVIMITPEYTVLHWPGTRGGWLQSVHVSGRTLWRTPEFLDTFAIPPGGGPPDRTPTPLDGQVRSDDLIVSTDGETLALAQRAGHTLVVDLRTGQRLWADSLPITRVYDLSHVGSTLVAAGASRDGEAQVLRPVVIAVDLRTGAARARLDPRSVGDHPRWVRSLPGGDALMASATGLTRYNPVDGAIRWTRPGDPGRGSIGGWIVGERSFVMDSELRLWSVALADGTVASEPLDTRDRITLPAEAAVFGDRFTIASAQGMLTYTAGGVLIGADGLDSSRLQIIGQTPTLTVMLELPGGFDTAQGELGRLLILGTPTGKLLASHRIRLHDMPTSALVLDGKIIIGQGVATLVLDAHPER